MYTLLHGRSNILLDYSEHKDLEKYEKIDKIESLFTNSKYDTPITTWLHTSGAAIDKITALYPSFM
jgi:hypothetical protein